MALALICSQLKKERTCRTTRLARHKRMGHCKGTGIPIVQLSRFILVQALVMQLRIQMEYVRSRNTTSRC